MKNCIYCGKEIDANSQFCPYCGSALPKEEVVQAPVYQEQPEAPVYQEQPVQEQPMAPRTNMTQEEFERINNVLNQKSKNEKMGLYGTIITVIFIIAAVIYGLINEDEFLVVFVPILVGMLALLFFVIYLIAYFKRKKLANRSDIEFVKAELMSDNVTYIADINVYLTKNYIVTAGAYSAIVKFDEIALVYKERRSTAVNGVAVPVGLFFIARLVNGKSVVIARSMNENNIDVLGELIVERIPNVMVGLTKENKKALKEIKRNYKNNH